MIIAYTTYVVSIAIIVTKYFDCITTQHQIRGVAMEFNPIARTLMHRLGIKTTIWLAFAITILVTAISQYWIQYQTDSILWDCGYILTGGFTALIQGATAVNNYNGRPNFVTKQLFRLLAKRP